MLMIIIHYYYYYYHHQPYRYYYYLSDHEKLHKGDSESVASLPSAQEDSAPPPASSLEAVTLDVEPLAVSSSSANHDSRRPWLD